MRHAFWNALIQVTILWLTITFCWAGFLWLVNGPWLVVGAAIGVMLPIPLAIVTIPFVLTWIGGRVSQVVRGEKVTLD
jgi:hypothetical protein